MRILIVNDDGIFAEGIYQLAKAAAKLGEVWIAAPKTQCSAMSHRITIDRAIRVEKEHILDGIPAYSIDGTPADCVKVALNHLLPEKPDIVFSGINHGRNIGIDIPYSGTVAACMEAILAGIPAIAFSIDIGGDYTAVAERLEEIITALQQRPIGKNEVWNVNFPACCSAEIKGILFDRIVSNARFYKEDIYTRTEHGSDAFSVMCHLTMIPIQEEGTDLAATNDGYISVGKIRHMVLRDEKE